MVDYSEAVTELGGPARVGRPVKNDDTRQRQREELLEAAVTTIRTSGARTNLAGIAAAAGYSKALLYDVFGSKAEFAMALSLHVNSRLIAAVFSDPDLAPAQRVAWQLTASPTSSNRILSSTGSWWSRPVPALPVWSSSPA